MGKRLKFREARRRQAENAVCAKLKAHSKRDLGPRTIACFDDFPSTFRKKIVPYGGYAIRPPEEWRCRIKSRSVERRFIDFVRFTFARFPVAPHLENLWIAESLLCVDDRLRPPANARDGSHIDIRRWHILAAQGASLYKQASHRLLSKAETHHFLAAPAEVTSSHQAFWYAVARAQVDDKHLQWTAEIGGERHTWLAEIVEQIPDRVIAWRSVDGGPNSGRVEFEPIEDGTRIEVEMEYEPEGFKEAVGALLGVDGAQVEEDLERFKDLVESRPVPTGAWRGRIESGRVVE